jgi:hypothetical protein
MKLKTRQATSGSKVVLAIGLILAAMSLVFVFIGIRQIKLERLYESEGATVDGIIASKRVEEKNGIDRETKRPIVTKTCFLKLRFPNDRGQEIEIENSVSKDRWDSAKEQDTVQIQYLPSDPAKSRIAGGSEKVKAYAFTGLGSVGALIGLVCLLFTFRQRS